MKTLARFLWNSPLAWAVTISVSIALIATFLR